MILQASAPPRWLTASARGSPAWSGQFTSLTQQETGFGVVCWVGMSSGGHRVDVEVCLGMESGRCLLPCPLARVALPCSPWSLLFSLGTRSRLAKLV